MVGRVDLNQQILDQRLRSGLPLHTIKFTRNIYEVLVWHSYLQLSACSLIDV